MQEPSKESGKSSTAAQTGIYDLVSVLTHEGITTDNGHYLAWVKQESGTWIKYDDTRLSPQQEEDIMKLSGDGTGKNNVCGFGTSLYVLNWYVSYFGNIIDFRRW